MSLYNQTTKVIDKAIGEELAALGDHMEVDYIWDWKHYSAS
jgi:hypothetical protein